MAKKRRRRERARRGGDDAAEIEQAGRGAPAGEPEWRLPSPLARIAGGVLAILTLVIAVVTITSAVSGDLAAADIGIRIVVGVLLIALAIGIAALSVAPAFVRALFVRS
jgi:hypothetical protein